MIARNIEKREQLALEIRKASQARENALDAIPESLTDREYDEQYELIFSHYEKIISALNTKRFALEYKESRNDWFRTFVQSFGVCSDRRITRKQADIFMRYSEPAHEYSKNRASCYYVRVGDLFVKTSVYGLNEPCYIDIVNIA